MNVKKYKTEKKRILVNALARACMLIPTISNCGVCPFACDVCENSPCRGDDPEMWMKYFIKEASYDEM